MKVKKLVLTILIVITLLIGCDNVHETLPPEPSVESPNIQIRTELIIQGTIVELGFTVDLENSVITVD